MDYEKKYKESLERAKENYHDGCLALALLEYIFPELKESEDEKVRQELLAVVNEPVDKVELKFKIGDWVVCEKAPKYTAFITGDIVQISNVAMLELFLHYKDCFRHWDFTKDAKKGDVLVHNSCVFIFMGLKDGIVQAINEFFPKPTNFGDPDIDDDYHPATKEQRELFFQKMKEAGYEWNAGKK